MGNHLQSLVTDPAPCERPIHPDRPPVVRVQTVPAIVGDFVYELFVPPDRASRSGLSSISRDVASVAQDDCINADVIAGDSSVARV